MNHIICQKCNTIIKINNNFHHKDIYNTHNVLCNECKKNIILYNKTESKKMFYLNDKDFINIKPYYSTNRSILYSHSDLIQSAIHKYGNLDIITNKKKKEELKKNKLLQIKNENKKIREELIIEYFNNNKLELKPYGDCYSFINNGYPPLNEIIQNEINKNEQKNIKRNELATELYKLNITYDESLDECYKYINNIGCRNLQETVRMIELDHFLQTKTNYNDYIEIHGKELAREYAIRQYMLNRDKNDNIINNIKMDVTVNFD